MTDVVSKKKRSWIMSRIKGKNTAPERKLFAILRSLGYRIQRHRKDLPGSPDAAIPSKKIALFVHGCLWHGHRGCRRAALPDSNRPFWRKKIEANRRRDARQIRSLRRMGWSAGVFWACRKITRASVKAKTRLLDRED